MRLLLAAIATALLQLPPANIAPLAAGSIQGIVLDPGDRPVSGAEVSALLVPAPFGYLPPRATSDSTGRFTISSLSSANYRISVSAPGYAPQEYGAPTSGRRGRNAGTVIPLNANQRIQDITVRLTGDGVLSGRITGNNGQPLLGMEVSALLRIYDATGGLALQPDNGSAQTNDRGEFRIAGLTPGRYYVRAWTPLEVFERQLEKLARSRGEPVPADRSPGNYATTYYPGVSERDRATELEVHAGTERMDVDFVLPRSQLYRIRGRVTDPGSSRMPEQLSFSVVPIRSDVISISDISTIPVRPDGTFELTDIPTGVFWVTAFVFGGPGRGYAVAKVIDADVEGLQITLIRDLAVSGSLEIEGQGAPRAADLDSTKIELRANFVPGQVGPPLGEIKMSSDGTFIFRGLLAMEHRLVVPNLPRDLFVKEARFGDVDAMTEPMQMNRIPTPHLSLVLARGGGLSGRVTDSDGKAVPNQQVVVIPNVMNPRPDLYRTATTEPNGRFALSGMAPGDYKVFAWKTLEPFRYFDREFVQSFEGQETSIHVDNSANVSIDVKLIR